MILDEKLALEKLNEATTIEDLRGKLEGRDKMHACMISV